MTARELFDRLAPLVAPAIEERFGRRDCCILAARVTIEVARYFGIVAAAVPVKVVLYNRAFARHVACGFADVGDRTKPSTWGDDSWSVGIGCGLPHTRERWDGHLIAVADDVFGDFAIQQAERPQHGILTGPALVGPYLGHNSWMAVEEGSGTVIEYTQITDPGWSKAPDWRDSKRRTPIVAALIREVKRTLAQCVA